MLLSGCHNQLDLLLIVKRVDALAFDKKRKEKKRKTSSIEENGIWSIAKVADIEEMLPYI